MAQASDTVAKRIFVTVAAAVILACLGYGWKIYQKRWLDQLEFTSNQIDKIYGPLLYQIQSNTQIWNSFNKYKNSIIWSNLDATPSEQILQWKRYMTTVFQPQNLLMKKIIEENTKLLLGSNMPPVFEQLIEHTNAYAAIISGWVSEEEPKLTAWIVFPNNFEACVKESYDELRKVQQELQNMIIPRTIDSPTPPKICEKRDPPMEKYPGPPV